MLKLHFLHHRKLLPKLCRCTWKSLTLFLHESLERRDIFPGGILVPQTFGGMANWNPHVYALITDSCCDREGKQYNMPKISDGDLEVIEELFAASVFRMLLDEGMISEKLVEKMRFWKHSGFSVHCGRPVKAEDEDSRKTLSEYISRAPFSLERMSFNEDSDGIPQNPLSYWCQVEVFRLFRLIECSSNLTHRSNYRNRSVPCIRSPYSLLRTTT